MSAGENKWRNNSSVMPRNFDTSGLAGSQDGTASFKVLSLVACESYWEGYRACRTP